MKKISTETIIRTIVLFVALINSVLTMLGKNPLPYSDTEIYQAVSSLATVIATIWAWWKNNSFTSAAVKADEYMKALKHQTNKETDDSNNEGK